MAAQQYLGQEQHLPALYQPLLKQQRQFRLLFMYVDDDTDDDDVISGILVPRALDNVTTRYIAVSHVWEAPDTCQSVLINGRPFPVSTNLLEFLKSHRRRCQELQDMRMMPLWIDSICINQADIVERSSQVMLMKSIYQNAGMVISWLGPSFPLCDWAFEVLRQFKEQIDNTHDPKASAVTDVSWLSSFPQACIRDSDSDGPLGSVVWDSIRELCGHEYWKRTWNFQEAVLGDLVMICCGDEVIHFTDAIQVIRWLAALNASIRKPESMDAFIWNMISSQDFCEHVMGLQYILRVWTAREIKNTHGWAMTNMLRDHEATDPRDKIYGSLGITDLNIIPDYSKSVRDVYVEAAAALMKERFEWVLTLSGTLKSVPTANEPLDVPSWVPDWRRSAPGIHSLNHPFTASKGSPVGLKPEIKGYSLHCSGIVWEEIVAVEPVLKPEDCLKFCCDYMDCRKTERYPSGMPHLRALFQTLLFDWETMVNCRSEPESMIFQVVACGLLHFFFSTEIKYRSENGRPQINNPLYALGLGAKEADLATTFWNQIVGTSREPNDCVITGPREHQPAAMNAIGEKLSNTVQAALSASLKGRKIFHTRSGYLGIGLESAQVGDRVCVAFDCNMPVLLRPENSYYTHIGPCHVVGLMEGEAMLDVRNGKRKPERFEIR